MIRKIIILFTFLIYTFSIAAQNPDGISKDLSRYYKKQQANHHLQKQITATEDANVVQFESLLEKFEWENKQINFNPLGAGTFAGDIDSDGKDDLVRAYRDIFDVSTDDLSDRVNRTLIFLGGDTSNELPDIIVNSFLYPAGDMDNDGFDDAIGEDFNEDFFFYKGSSNGYVRSGQLSISLKNDVIGFHDFNNDGFDDILTTETRNIESQYSIVYGGATEADFRQVDYDTNNENVLLRTVRHGSRSLLYEFLLSDMLNLSLEGYSFDEADREASLQFSRSYDLTSIIRTNSRIDIQAADVNGDDFEDILVNPTTSDSRSFNNILIINSTDGPANEFSTLSSGYNWVPIGDFNNDGLEDFIRYLRSSAIIGFSVEIDDKPEIQGAFFFENISTPFNTPLGERLRFGDLNGDNFDDIKFTISNGDGSGNRTVFGNDSLFFENTQDVIYPSSDYTNIVNYSDSRTLDDLNGDNINDLVLLYNDHLDVHLGGVNFSSTPDFTIPTINERNNVELGSGDFNGDGFSDIVVSTTKVVESNRFSTINVYFGGEDFDTEVDHTINIPVGFQNRFAWSVNAIGDINADNYDDFALMTFQDPRVYIYLGGENLSPDADIQLDLRDSFGFDNITGNGFGFGYRFNGVGDINGDGIDDLTVSDFDRRVTSDDGTQTVSRAGAVFVIYGKEFPRDTPAELAPSEVLIQKDLALNEQFRNFGWSVKGGDFNGDGTNDIIAVTDESRTAEGIGLEYIFVYFGGTNFDDVADLSFKLPSAPFNAEGEHIEFYLGEIIVIPDLDGDGADELLVCTDAINQNAVLFLGGQTDELVADAIFESPNKSTSLGANNSFLNLQFRSGLGDFNNDGRLEVVLPQTEDRNFRNIPLYVFPVENPNRETQTITFETIGNKNVDDQSFELVATASSTLPVSFEVLEGPASVTGTTVTLSGEVGKVVIRASQEGNTMFFAAEPVDQSFEVEVITSLASSPEEKFTTYPNPVNGVLTVQATKLKALQIRSLSGQLIEEFRNIDNGDQSVSIDFSHINPGIYLIEMYTESEKYLKKIIKK